jgi:hypothetical protein
LDASNARSSRIDLCARGRHRIALLERWGDRFEKLKRVSAGVLLQALRVFGTVAHRAPKL